VTPRRLSELEKGERRRAWLRTGAVLALAWVVLIGVYYLVPAGLLPARHTGVGAIFRLGTGIALFVAIVLVIGLTLVYLSFQRISAVTETAASQFIGKVAELSADRIGSQLKLVRDNVEILNALPSIQSAEIEDNPRHPQYVLTVHGMGYKFVG